MAKTSYYVLGLFCFILSDISAASKCMKQDPCSCTIDDLSYINLTQLHPPEPERPFFQDSNEDISYFFSGCNNKDFIPKNYKLIVNKTITGVSLVKCNSSITPTPNTTDSGDVHQECKSIGDAKDIKFDLVPNSDNEYQIIYANSNPILPSIRLACDTHNSTFLKILNSDTDSLTLYSPLVCTQHISHHHLSAGSIFCIIFFVTSIVYFIGGGLWNYFSRGATGVEVIPNFDFWSSLPGLVKGGMVYIFSGCVPVTVITEETYDRI